MASEKKHPSEFSFTYADLCVRRWIEMVGVLHSMGFGRLRLACRWENAGPSPVWWGDIAPGSYFRSNHGSILARSPHCDEEQAVTKPLKQNDLPMLSSRRCKPNRRDYPWPDYDKGSVADAACGWVRRYPELAAEGRGEDLLYSDWYARMLLATAPAGIIAANFYFEPAPGYMYVACGPEGTDRFELPPPSTG